MENVKHYLGIISSEIKEAFTENKYIILIITAIFIITAFIGFFFAQNLHFMTPVVNNFQHRITSGQVQLTTNSLYVNNLKATLTIFLGSFLMGVVGILAIIINALLIGLYAAVYAAHGKILLYFLLIIPHGIFEIPALIIASSAGFGMLVFVILFLKNLVSPDYTYAKIFDPLYNLDKISTTETIKMSWRKNGLKFKQSLILLVISAILLIIAACIEANITKPLAFIIYGFLS